MGTLHGTPHAVVHYTLTGMMMGWYYFLTGMMYWCPHWCCQQQCMCLVHTRLQSCHRNHTCLCLGVGVEGGGCMWVCMGVYVGMHGCVCGYAAHNTCVLYWRCSARHIHDTKTHVPTPTPPTNTYPHPFPTHPRTHVASTLRSWV